MFSVDIEKTRFTWFIHLPLYPPNDLTQTLSLWAAAEMQEQLQTSYFSIRGESLEKQNSWLGCCDESCPCRGGVTAVWRVDKQQTHRSLWGKNKWEAKAGGLADVAEGCLIFLWGYRNLCSFLEYNHDTTVYMWLHLPSINTSWWHQVTASSCDLSRAACHLHGWLLPRLLSSLSSSTRLPFLPPFLPATTFLLASSSKGLCAPVTCGETFIHPVLECSVGIINSEKHHSWCRGEV